MKVYDGEGIIKIGWPTSSLKAHEFHHLAAYKDGEHIKDVGKEEARKRLGIEAHTVPVNPNPAPTAEGAIWIA